MQYVYGVQLSLMFALICVVDNARRCCRRRCRANEPLFHRSLHGRDAGENVLGRLPGILRVHVQSVRLVRRRVQYRRGDIHLHRHHASVGRQRPALCKAATRLQSHQVRLRFLLRVMAR